LVAQRSPEPRSAPASDPAYTHTDIAGKAFDRAAWLAYVPERAANGITNTIEFEDVHVHRDGDIAFAIQANVYRPSDGSPKRGGRLRFAQVSVRMSDGWKRIAFEATPVNDESVGLTPTP
jgi:ketosteroid isomerase-like protein